MLSAAFFLLWRSGGGVGAEGNTGKVQFRSRKHYKDDIAFFQNLMTPNLGDRVQRVISIQNRIIALRICFFLLFSPVQITLMSSN
jgi:hypothetical protein